LTWHSFGTAVAYRAYALDDAFLRNSVYGGLYIYVCACVAVFCTFLACESRLVRRTRVKKTLRVIAWVLLYCASTVPVLERVVHCIMFGSAECANGISTAIGGHLGHTLWAGVGLAIYAFHIPECFSPGTFDILGHSHQILHVCGIFATYKQMWALFADMESRDIAMATATANSLLRMVAIVLACNACVVCFYVYRLLVRCTRRVASDKRSHD